LAAIGCARDTSRGTPAAQATTADDAEFARARERMVMEHLVPEGINDERVLAALRRVPRHRFVPDSLQQNAYEDRPLPIGHGQTISQPFIVAFMSQNLMLKPGDKVLEVGTGSGYQAAVLAELGARVFSIEIVEPLGREAAARLKNLGYESIQTRVGDGYLGWPEEAPFDAIIVTAAPDHVPPALKSQLRDGGRLILPVGDAHQELLLITRRGDAFDTQKLLPVRFVPMTGEAQK
jgi:protein-L-isoaspartate(D-aspartate) O-methyltransferase